MDMQMMLVQMVSEDNLLVLVMLVNLENKLKELD
jgi:hypothetical protein